MCCNDGEYLVIIIPKSVSSVCVYVLRHRNGISLWRHLKHTAHIRLSTPDSKRLRKSVWCVSVVHAFAIINGHWCVCVCVRRFQLGLSPFIRNNPRNHIHQIKQWQSVVRRTLPLPFATHSISEHFCDVLLLLRLSHFRNVIGAYEADEDHSAFPCKWFRRLLYMLSVIVRQRHSSVLSLCLPFVAMNVPQNKWQHLTLCSSFMAEDNRQLFYQQLFRSKLFGFSIEPYAHAPRSRRNLEIELCQRKQ